LERRAEGVSKLAESGKMWWKFVGYFDGKKKTTADIKIFSSTFAADAI
jgi:hypothetical protein